MKIKVRKILELRKLEVQPKRSNIATNGHSEPKNKENDQRKSIWTIKEIIQDIFPGWKNSPWLLGKDPRWSPSPWNFRTPKSKTLMKRKSRSHTKEWESKWHQTSQKQPQRAEHHGGMPAKFGKKPLTTYNSVNQKISSKLPSLRNLLEDMWFIWLSRHYDMIFSCP